VLSERYSRCDVAGLSGRKPEQTDHGRLTLRQPFEVTRLDENWHEVRDGDGEVVAWCPDRSRALVLAGLLEAAVRG
jgi:hypothetical protein